MTEPNAGATPEQTTEPKATFLATEIAPGRYALVPQNFGQIWRLAELFASTGAMVPEMYQQRPDRCAMAIMWGMELGISAIQAIQGIAIIGDRPAVWGDLQHALVLTHPDFESIDETPILEGDIVIGATCTVKRRGKQAVTRTFTMAQAAKAGLIARAKGYGPWATYPDRMCQMRARSWAERDAMPDALRGLSSADELVDVTDVGRDRTVPRQAEPDPERIRMPEALEHEPNPLVETTVVRDPEHVIDAIDRPVFTAEDDDLGPSGPALTSGEVAEDAALAAQDRQQRVRGALGAAGELFGGAAAPARALTKGERQLVDLELDAAKDVVTEQDINDELGDAINGDNVKRAIDLIHTLTEKRRAAGD